MSINEVNSSGSPKFKKKVTNCRNIVNKLSGNKQTSIQPKTCSDTELANKFTDYFDSKIKRIRDNIDNDLNYTTTNMNRNTVTVLENFLL